MHVRVRYILELQTFNFEQLWVNLFVKLNDICLMWCIAGLLSDKQCVITTFLSIRLTAIFPGGPELADIRMSPFWVLLELRMR